MRRSGRDRGPSEAELQRFVNRLARASSRQGWFERALRLVIRWWCRLVGWRIEARGATGLPRRGGVPGAGCVIAAAPHRAWIEPFLLVAAWPPDAGRLVWLADGRTVTRSWWRRRLLPSLGVIPISGTFTAPRAYAALAAEVLASGRALAVFPEVGPPSPPAETRPLSAGFAYLALGAGAPVVPVVVGGTHRIARGSAFSVDFLDAVDTGSAGIDPFTPDGRERAQDLQRAIARSLAAILPERTAQADAQAPARARWRWLGTLFH
jgi:1-acyl-sn-glycerol-3-phosphate acyltransferase